MSSKLKRYKDEVASEGVCDVCSAPMNLVKGKPRANKYDKKHDVFECTLCPHRFRARTQNEILRDMGERD